MDNVEDRKLRILFVVGERDLTNKDWSLDYQCDMLFHGLVSLGHDVTDTSYIRYLSQPLTDDMRPHVYGLGFSIGGKLPDRSGLDRDKASITARIESRYYDLVIFGSVWRCTDYVGEVMRAYPRDRIVFVDGEDHTRVMPQYVGAGLYFKREIDRPQAGVHPISFAIPEEQFSVADAVSDKVRDMADLIPGDSSTYVYTDERSYYNAYATSRFALTCRKGGWDCLRHYEIIAAGALPVFRDFDSCPASTMTTWPRDLQLEANSLAEQWHDKADASAYDSLLSRFRDYAAANLTTRKLASYVLSVASDYAHLTASAPVCTGSSGYVNDIGELVLDAGGSDLTVAVAGGGDPTPYAVHAMLATGRVGRVYVVADEDALVASCRRLLRPYSGYPRVVFVRSAAEDAFKSSIPHVDMAYVTAGGTSDGAFSSIRAVCNSCDTLAGDGYGTRSGVHEAVDGVYGGPDITRGRGLWLVRDPGRRLCVVIPMYNKTLTQFELDSLHQCVNVLSRHDIAIMCPDDYDQSSIPADIIGRVRLEYFDRRYFTGKESYSKLCTSRSMYDRFGAYTHILLYQLDGYVFRDDLFERWMKYDYVGAPWCYRCHTCSLSGRPDMVGNGGVSLRRVGVFREIVGGRYVRCHPEDVNLTTIEHNPTRAYVLRKPSCREALHFSIETRPDVPPSCSGTATYPPYPYPDYNGSDVSAFVPSFCHRLQEYDKRLFSLFKNAALEINKHQEV